MACRGLNGKSRAQPGLDHGTRLGDFAGKIGRAGMAS